MDLDLNEIARFKSMDMAENNYFDHTSPTFGNMVLFYDHFLVRGYNLAENIAVGYSTPEAVVNGWMNSPGHKENILRGNITHIGVGFYDYYWTQAFMGRFYISRNSGTFYQVKDKRLLGLGL